MKQILSIILMVMTLGAVNIQAAKRKSLSLNDLIKYLDSPTSHKPNKDVRQVIELYKCPQNDELQKIIALQGMLLDTGDDSEVFRVVPLDEMINSSENLGSDFVAMGIVPLIDNGGNIFLVYQVANNSFGLCDISDLDEDDSDPLFEIYPSVREYIESKL